MQTECERIKMTFYLLSFEAEQKLSSCLSLDPPISLHYNSFLLRHEPSFLTSLA